MYYENSLTKLLDHLYSQNFGYYEDGRILFLHFQFSETIQFLCIFILETVLFWVHVKLYGANAVHFGQKSHLKMRECRGANCSLAAKIVYFTYAWHTIGCILYAPAG